MGLGRCRQGSLVATRRRASLAIFASVCLMASIVEQGGARADSLPPTITGFSPASGPVGTPVVISGTGFSTSPVTTVKFSGANATSFAVDSDTQITARIPAGAPDGVVSLVTDAATVTSQGTVDVTLRHIVVIVMENHSFAQVDGNTSASYINDCLIHRDLGRCPDPGMGFPTANYTQSYSSNHAGSLLAYLDLTSGSDPNSQGLPCNFTILGCPDTDRNIVDQLEAAGLSWASYAEDYPAPGTCSLTNTVKRVGASDVAYVSGHVPFLYYTDIRTKPARCTRFFGNPSGITKAGLPVGGDAGLKQLTIDSTNGSLPAFALVTPNEYTDMHTVCSSGVCPPGAPDPIAMGDRFLAYWIPHLMAGLEPSDRIIVTWDESSPKDWSGCCMVPGGPNINGGHIPTFVIGGTVTEEPVVTPVTTYSFLTAIEDTFSLPGNIPGATARQAHQLNQLYGICGCTPLVQDPGREGPPATPDTDPHDPWPAHGIEPIRRDDLLSTGQHRPTRRPRSPTASTATATPRSFGSATSSSFTDTGLIPGSQPHLHDRCRRRPVQPAESVEPRLGSDHGGNGGHRPTHDPRQAHGIEPIRGGDLLSTGQHRPTRRPRSPTASTATATPRWSGRRRPRASPTRGSSPGHSTPTRSMPSTAVTTRRVS